MKITLLVTTFATLLFFSNAVNAQRNIYKLDKKVEHTLNTAAKHMIIFILSQNELEYYRAIEQYTKAGKINDTLVSQAENLKGIRKKIQDYITDDRKEEFKCYCSNELRTMIINEKDDTRNIKVRFRGKTYKLSDNSKKLYDNFITYLPRN